MGTKVVAHSAVRRHHRGCSRYSHLTPDRSQSDLATKQQRDRVSSLRELAYHCPANAAACAGHGDHAPMDLYIAHAYAVPNGSASKSRYAQQHADVFGVRRFSSRRSSGVR